MTEKKDIFDRIMSLPGLRLFNGFYVKNKSVLLYLFFGGLTTVISIVSLMLINSILINSVMSEYETVANHIANICSWVLAVSFAYVTNRTWVFESRARGWQILSEMLSFFVGRVVTLGIEELILLVFVTILAFDIMWVKIAAQIIVLLSNYLLSKFIVFKNKSER